MVKTTNQHDNNKYYNIHGPIRYSQYNEFSLDIYIYIHVITLYPLVHDHYNHSMVIIIST